MVVLASPGIHGRQILTHLDLSRLTLKAVYHNVGEVWNFKSVRRTTDKYPYSKNQNTVQFRLESETDYVGDACRFLTLVLLREAQLR